MTIVDELKEEHKFLTMKLTAVKAKGIVSEEAKKVLFECKNGLLAHLKKEDDKLYPVLRKAAETDESIKNMLETFDENMQQVSKAALAFFAKYNESDGGTEFGQDIATLIATLSARILKEEHVLYIKYLEVGGD